VILALEEAFLVVVNLVVLPTATAESPDKATLALATFIV